MAQIPMSFHTELKFCVNQISERFRLTASNHSTFMKRYPLNIQYKVACISGILQVLIKNGSWGEDTERKSFRSMLQKVSQYKGIPFRWGEGTNMTKAPRFLL